jgi:asparagine synthase (glutamine-hydrolysing)
MCGVAGIFQLNPIDDINFRDKSRSMVESMIDAMSNRGPDESGLLQCTPVTFGHRRLSILDLTSFGSQPMQINGEGPMITFNGEIYNFKELRVELELDGSFFGGHSDTEVILNLYIKQGLEGLKRLEGMFALGIWDPNLQTLVLMRDRLGIKPLFYSETKECIFFASSIEAILVTGGVNAHINDQSLSEYLWFGNVFEDRTIYEDIRALQPGHWMIISPGKRRVEPWWCIEEWLDKPLLNCNSDEASSSVLNALDIAVKRQLVSDVPVGIFLSGGLDSSSIAAAAALAKLDKPLKTFTANFDYEEDHGEIESAAAIAYHLKLSNHEIQISAKNLPEILVKLASAHGEPFADAANIPLFLMCAELGGSKVVLQGDGGDEIFAGYRRYILLSNLRWWKLLPNFLTIPARYLGLLGTRFARIIEALGSPDPATRMALLMTEETLNNRPEDLFMPERRCALLKSTDPFLVYRNAAERFKKFDAVKKMMLTDLTVQLPSQFLTKVDRATMAASVEARVPLLDEGLVRMVINMPSSWNIRGGIGKIILRKSQAKRLPNNILKAPKKGFGVPYKYWLRTSLFTFARTKLLDQSFLEKFQLDGSKIEKMLTQHKLMEVDRGFMLWKLLQLALFSELKIPKL